MDAIEINTNTKYDYKKAIILFDDLTYEECTVIESVDGETFVNKPISDYKKIESSKVINSFRVFSIILQITELSFNKNYFNVFVEKVMAYIFKYIYIKHNNILVVVEYGETKVFHANVLLLHNKVFPKSFTDDIINGLPSAIKFNIDENEWKKVVVTISGELIRSTGSFINYLKKLPIAAASNRYETISAFLNFDRTHIFPATSIPKRQKRNANGDFVNSDNGAVLFFTRKFQDGIIDYNDILKCNEIQKFLHICCRCW